MKRNRIGAIKNSDIHKITSGQVIIDLKTAVKELLENSLDANADKIEIVFKNYGLESVECSDNGEGISEDNFSEIGSTHHTSKLSSFDDVSRVTSFGFRGEAIASLCQMSNITIITTVKGPKAHKLVFNYTGLQSNSVCSRNKGTTVQISNLFDSLPVRKKEFVKNYKRQFSKCIEIIQCYAIIQTSVKIAVWNILPSGRKSLLLSSTGNSDIKKNLVSLFGSGASKGLNSIDLSFTVSGFNPPIMSQQIDELPFVIKLNGEISQISFGCGRLHKDRQFIYVNKRPVDYAKITKCINECYQSFNNVQFPAFVIDFQVDPSFLDINVTPDKRTINIHFEEFVIDALHEQLSRFFQEQNIILPKAETGATGIVGIKETSVDKLIQPHFEIDNAALEHSTADKNTNEELANVAAKPILDSKLHENPQNKENDAKENKKMVDDIAVITQLYDEGVKSTGVKIDMQATEAERGHLNNDISSKTRAEYESPDSFELPEAHSLSETPAADASSEDGSRPLKRLKTSTQISSLIQLDSYVHEPDVNVEIIEPVDSSDEVIVEIDDVVSSQPVSRDRNDNLVIHSKPGECCCESHSHTPHSHEGENGENEDVEFQFDEEESDDEQGDQISTLTTTSRCPPKPYPPPMVTRERKPHRFDMTYELESRQSFSVDYFNTLQKIVDVIEMDKLIKHERLLQEIASIDNREQAENYLTLTVDKDDFRKMKVVGQFNLGFIIVTRKNETTFDMFIVDQHASDEKYNFEMLQKNTVFKSQTLLTPKPLELSAIDELLVMEYKEVFTKNGFKIQINPDDEPGSRVRLISYPVSKNTMFTEQDFHELIHLIRENDGHNMSNIRCSKIRSMFAMRACRGSIMVGKPLSDRTMKKVVHHLSELDKPWNCPHGRPTMRHLMELKDWDSFQDDYVV